MIHGTKRGGLSSAAVSLGECTLGRMCCSRATDRQAFMLPERTLPRLWLDNGEVLRSSMYFTSDTVSEYGRMARSSVASPATCGVAIEVPLAAA